MIFHRALLREFAGLAGAVFMTLFAIALTTRLIRLLGQAAGGKIPSDAVVAFLGFFDHGFDLVASGINYGANLGDDITYSGTVSAAMESGCAVITNLDADSPAGLVHMQHLIDIATCDRLPDVEQTKRIGLAARDIAHSRYGWDQLVSQLRSVVQL